MKVYAALSTIGAFTFRFDEDREDHGFDNDGPVFVPVTLGRVRELADGRKLFDPQTDGKQMFINTEQIVGIEVIEVEDEAPPVDIPFEASKGNEHVILSA